MTYENMIEKLLNLFNATKFCTLATANNKGEVSASQICLINDGLTLYFQTDKTFEKIQNIKENNKVSINCGAFYFKGKATIEGHPTNNLKFIELIKEKHIDTFNHYTKLPNEVLVRVDLTEAKIWGVDTSKDVHNQETIAILNFETKEIKTIICDKM